MQTARIAAARTANQERILPYWHLGQGIVAKQKLSDRDKSMVVTLAINPRVG